MQTLKQQLLQAMNLEARYRSSVNRGSHMASSAGTRIVRRAIGLDGIGRKEMTHHE